ncbi:hypothetical protein ACR2R6_23285 (plasmid) [Methylocaldum gracile subsp. desertum]|uniref:hypothetical protein n=1 Tax=Methylocaldum sp. GT1BW TaxID=3438964 RepID=UPI003D9FF8B6
MTQTRCYALKVFLEHEPPSLCTLKGDIFISPHGRLCGIGNEAHLSGEVLANRYKVHLLGRIQKRYGAGSSVEVVEGSSSRDVAARIEKDSKRVLDRLAKVK